MADKGFNTTSTSQFQNFSKELAEAKQLLAKQEELTQKILEAEAKIAGTRNSNLEGYFKNYFEKLDSVIEKQKNLYKDFLELEREISGRSINKDSAKKGSEKQSFEKLNAGHTNSGKDLTGNTKISQQLDKIINLLSGQVRYFQQEGISPETADTKASKTQDISEPQTTTADKTSTQSNSVISATDRAALKDASSLVTIFDEIEALNKLSKEARDQITAAVKSGDRSQIESAEGTYKDLAILLEAHLSDVEKSRKAHLDRLSDHEKAVREKQIELELLQDNSEEARQARLTELRLKNIQNVYTAEIEAQKLLNEITTEIKYASTTEGSMELGKQRAGRSTAEDTSKSIKAQEEERIKWVAEQELKAKLKNGGILDKRDAAKIQKDAAEKFKFDGDTLNKITKLRLSKEAEIQKEQEKADKKRAAAEGETRLATITGKGQTLTDRLDAFKDLAKNNDGDVTAASTIKAAAAVAANAISDLAKQLNDKIDQIASQQGFIDTRLQGSNNKTSSGSYWNQLTKDMMSVGAVTPFFKQEDFANNIKTLVDKGISFDLKQRAFLMTIQEKIANTFNVADGTLLRLIRLQQQDSTAGRLGMESALNSFLNNMYENTEYLKDVASQVRSSLEEMEALMEGDIATEVEYQVQKWMGSLYSVGMSQNAVQNIAATLGQIASGQIEGLTGGSGTGNLLVMAANAAGIQISDILADGLDADETNRLLQATVNYLAEIANSTKDNNVVQQQLAGVFGVKASDLRAATNLSTKNSVQNIFDEYRTYDNMLSQLNTMAGSMWKRTSLGEMMSNIWTNGQYTMASSMANNPVAYLTYKMASLLESATGGINLPFVSVMGSGVDLNTTVADLMRVAAMGTGILGSLGPMISGLSASFNGQAMLRQMGIGFGNSLAITPRGNGLGGGGYTGGGNETTSGSGYVGNASSSDIKNSTLQEAEDTKKQQMIEAKEEAEINQIDFINNNVLKIYEVLEDVASGKRSLRVRMDNYGLIGGGKDNPSLGGVSPGTETTPEQSNPVPNGGSLSFSGWTIS